jgi:hypothetical protein
VTADAPAIEQLRHPGEQSRQGRRGSGGASTTSSRAAMRWMVRPDTKRWKSTAIDDGTQP